METQALSWENCVLHLRPEEPLSQLSAECQIKTQCNSKVWLTSIISQYMLGLLSVIQDTLTHTQEESFVTSGTHQATGRCRLGSFLQSSKNLFWHLHLLWQSNVPQCGATALTQNTSMYLQTSRCTLSLAAFTCFLFCFMNKYDSRLLKCLFL